MDKCVDSSHEGNGTPGHGVLFPAVDNLLSAVSALMDVCADTGADSRSALALVTRRENQLIHAAARYDAKIKSLRLQVGRLESDARVSDDIRADTWEMWTICSTALREISKGIHGPSVEVAMRALADCAKIREAK